MNFPLKTAFPVSHRFWVVVFSFSFVSRCLLILSWSCCWPNHCLIICYLASMSSCVFQVFFLWLIYSLIVLKTEKILNMISVLNLLRLFCVLTLCFFLCGMLFISPSILNDFEKLCMWIWCKTLGKNDIYMKICSWNWNVNIIIFELIRKSC